MVKISIGKTLFGGEVRYGFYAVNGNHPKEPDYVDSLGQLKYFVSGVMAGQVVTGIKWSNGSEEKGLRPLSPSELQEIVSEPHYGSKVSKAFLTQGLLKSE